MAVRARLEMPIGPKKGLPRKTQRCFARLMKQWQFPQSIEGGADQSGFYVYAEE